MNTEQLEELFRLKTDLDVAKSLFRLKSQSSDFSNIPLDQVEEVWTRLESAFGSSYGVRTIDDMLYNLGLTYYDNFGIERYSTVYINNLVDQIRAYFENEDEDVDSLVFNFTGESDPEDAYYLLGTYVLKIALENKINRFTYDW